MLFLGWLRCAFLLALVIAAGGNFVVEQPHSSLLFRHDRMRWLCQRVKAFCIQLSSIFLRPPILSYLRSPVLSPGKTNLKNSHACCPGLQSVSMARTVQGQHGQADHFVVKYLQDFGLLVVCEVQFEGVPRVSKASEKGFETCSEV